MSGWSGLGRRNSRRVFRDRREAGQVLADELASYRGDHNLLVLGLARGGVPVGWEVASSLRAPLDVFLVRKLGVPQWQELAMGALATGGGVVVNDSLVRNLGISDEQLQTAIDRETEELHRRECAYRGGRAPLDIAGNTVILVDDGIATGASMLAAVRAVRAANPAKVVVAVPVGPASACRQLAEEADDVVCATMPPGFEAVGQVFEDFHQVTDDEVREFGERGVAFLGLVGRIAGVTPGPFPQRVDDEQHHTDHAGTDTHPGDELITGDDSGHQGREADDGEHKRNDQH
jgi:putative phosphoribosyl transferase